MFPEQLLGFLNLRNRGSQGELAPGVHQEKQRSFAGTFAEAKFMSYYGSAEWHWISFTCKVISSE
jgi:hypothetical protein